jgi:hypothetical protein
VEARFPTKAGATVRAVEDLPKFLERDDGFVWLDIPQPDKAVASLLSQVFGLRSTAVRLHGA